MINKLIEQPANLWNRLTGQPVERPAAKTTKTMAVNPSELPGHYPAQISALYKTYLNIDMAPEQVIPYHSQVYQKLVLMTSKDGRLLRGLIGFTVMEVEGRQLIYVGALVVQAGFRGGSKLYLPLFFKVLAHKLRHLHSKSYLFGAIVNPYAYAAGARRINSMLPSPDAPTISASLLDLAISGLKTLYGLDDARHFDRQRGLVHSPIALQPVIEKPLDLNQPHLRFFAERNPDFQSGVALIYMVPLTAQMLGHVFTTLVLKPRHRAAAGRRH